MRSRYLFAVIVVLLSLGLAACGGGDEDGEVSEPTVAGQPSPAAQATPEGTPVISGNLFEFQERGYSVEFPEGWTPRPNFLPGPDFTVDAFFAPEEVQGIQANIAITCETVSQEMTLREYLDQKMDVVRQIVQVEPEVSSRDIAGQDAFVFQFERKAGEVSLQKTDAVFITERCGWDVALTAPAGEQADYRNLFDQFLESFRLLP